MDYEPGMQIIWDVITREVVVIFRGTVTSLPGKFADRQAGIEAGELVCRNGGWDRNETLIPNGDESTRSKLIAFHA